MPKESKSSLSLSLFNIYAGKVHASTGMCESGTPSSGSLVRKHTTSFTESSMTCSLHILEVYTTCFFDHATQAGREGGSHLNAYILWMLRTQSSRTNKFLTKKDPNPKPWFLSYTELFGRLILWMLRTKSSGKTKFFEKKTLNPKPWFLSYTKLFGRLIAPKPCRLFVCLFVCLKLLPRASSSPKRLPRGFEPRPRTSVCTKAPGVAPASRNYCLSYGPRNFLIKLYIVTTLRVLCHKYKRPHRQPLQVATPRSAPCMYV
jgi:hypothetical protein